MPRSGPPEAAGVFHHHRLQEPLAQFSFTAACKSGRWKGGLLNVSQEARACGDGMLLFAQLLRIT